METRRTMKMTSDSLEVYTGLSKEKLDEIFSDEEKSRVFYLIFIFSMATGKDFQETLAALETIQGDSL